MLAVDSSGCWSGEHPPVPGCRRMALSNKFAKLNIHAIVRGHGVGLAYPLERARLDVQLDRILRRGAADFLVTRLLKSPIRRIDGRVCPW